MYPQSTPDKVWDYFLLKILIYYSYLHIHPPFPCPPILPCSPPTFSQPTPQILPKDSEALHKGPSESLIVGGPMP